MAKLMKCIKEPSANKHFPNPYKVGEKVIYLGEVERKEGSSEKFQSQFIKIKRLKPIEVRVESRTDFAFIEKEK